MELIRATVTPMDFDVKTNRVRLLMSRSRPSFRRFAENTCYLRRPGRNPSFLLLIQIHPICHPGWGAGFVFGAAFGFYDGVDLPVVVADDAVVEEVFGIEHCEAPSGASRAPGRFC